MLKLQKLNLKKSAQKSNSNNSLYIKRSEVRKGLGFFLGVFNRNLFVLSGSVYILQQTIYYLQDCCAKADLPKEISYLEALS